MILNRLDLKTNTRQKDRGQGLVEFALVLPVLIIIAFGVLDLARVFFGVIAITNASREGARYLTQHPDDNQPDGAGVKYAGTKNAARQESLGSFVNITQADVNVIPECRDLDGFTGCDHGFPIRVVVTHRFDLIMGWLLPSPIIITRDTDMMVP